MSIEIKIAPQAIKNKSWCLFIVHTVGLLNACN